MNSSFPDRWSFSYLKFTKIRTAEQENSQEPQQEYRLGTVSIKMGGGDGGALTGYTGSSPSASLMAQKIQLFGPREGFLTHQWIITGNK